MDTDWLLETEYAMGVRSGTRHEYPGRKARHSLRGEIKDPKTRNDGDVDWLLETGYAMGVRTGTSL